MLPRNNNKKGQEKNMKREYCEIIEDFNKLNDLINKYKKIIKKLMNMKLKNSRSSLDD